jgi:hypothetical protein
MIIRTIFNATTSYFHKNSFHYFEDSFNDETNLMLRYASSILAWLVPLAQEELVIYLKRLFLPSVLF